MELRQDAIARLKGLPQPDVVILGGGVNGVAILRDLALNNVSAVLIERGDFCRGASGASSRMAHGGLRYLENREFDLVRHALEERDLLLKHAPHAVAPQEFLLPVENKWRGTFGTALNFIGLGHRKTSPSALGMKAALTLYDRFQSSMSLPSHQLSLSRKRLPDGAQDRFTASLGYFDGKFTNPEAFVFEMLEDAMMQGPHVTALNYVDFSVGQNGTLTLNGDGMDCDVHPKLIINATGAWLDQTNAALQVPTEYVTAVKGAQIILDRPDLLERLAGRAVYFPDLNGRFVICAPLEKTVLVGTSEVVVSDASDATIAQSEVDYLLGAMNVLFDDLIFSDADILVATTGARPLQKVKAGSVTAAPRDHAIHVDKTPAGQPLVSLAGGKWTTFRSFAAEATDLALRQLSKNRHVSTRDRNYPGRLLNAVDTARSGRLAQRYGAIGATIMDFCALKADAPLKHAPSYSRREITWLVIARGAVYLDDLILRRTRLALERPISDALLNEIAQIMAQALHQDADWATHEVQRVSTLPTVRYQPMTQFVPQDDITTAAQ